MKIETVSIKQFATTLVKLAKSDRYNLVAVSGVMGVGKSCLMDKLAAQYSLIAQTEYTPQNNMTWERQELNVWVDGDGEDTKEQKPEYTAIVADELISMMNKRNWYKSGQKGMIELLNKCRDRHLLLLGGVPVFDSLDNMFKDITGFWIFLPARGVAWVFEPEINPFSSDVWNMKENHKLFRKSGRPYKSYNFVCEIRFSDWTPKAKKEYYNVRNEKRKNTENQDDKQHTRVHDSVKQRNDLIRYAVNNHLLTREQAIKETGMSKQAISQVVRGVR